MKNSKIYLFVCLVLLASCGSNKVVYAKYGKLKLAENEVNAYPLSGNEVSAFETCCYTESDQIFLNRKIDNKTDGYQIFISVSEAIMQTEFASVQKADPHIQVLDTKSALVSKIKVDGYFLKKDNYCVARFTYLETKSAILVIFDIASVDEATAKKFYEEMVNYLDEKIHL